MIGAAQFDLNVSVPIVFEDEHRQIYFLWRPFLRDPEDDLVLELAVEAACDCIVTHNVSDFTGVEQFGIRVPTPAQFLKRIGPR